MTCEESTAVLSWKLANFVINDLKPTKLSIPIEAFVKARELCNTLEHDWLFLDLIASLDIRPATLRVSYLTIAEKVLQPTKPNWGRVIALLHFSRHLSDHLHQLDLHDLRNQIPTWFSIAISSHMSSWIDSQDSWLFSKPKTNYRYYIPIAIFVSSILSILWFSHH